MTKKHLHKYKKKTIGSNGYVVFKCMLPACPHYIRFGLAENALCLCNRCNEAFILTRALMELTLPHCDNCTVHKKKTNIPKLKDLMEKLG